jgi:pimeloyl-ACP methyl ester carboxylesterase
MQIRDLEFNVSHRGEGTTFIWGHGLIASMAAEDTLDWFNWPEFPTTVRLIRYDARGHGRTPASARPEDYHWRNLGRDMLAVANAFGAETFIAGGASMGCATTIYAALQAPERLKGMVLVIPPTAWETRADQGKLYQRFSLLGGLLGGKRMAQMMGGNLDRMVPSWLIDAEPEKMTGVAQGLSMMTRGALRNLFKGAALTNLPPREELEALVDIPCIILAWVGDATHPVSTAEELHRLLPGSELFIAQGYQDFKTLPQRMHDFVLAHT